MAGIINDMARQGRNGDTTVAHMSPGEIVIPKEVVASRPDIVAHVAQGIQQMGGDASAYQVGRAARRNPTTGAMEFASTDEITAAYEQQLGRAPDAAGLAYWSDPANGFDPTGGGFATGVAAEKASAQTAAPSYTDYGGTQVRTDVGETSALADATAAFNKASGQNQTVEQYDSIINPSTYGARWGVSAPPPAGAKSSASGGSAAGNGSTSLGAPTPWVVGDNQTVAGLINQYTDPNSPIIQQAVARSNDSSNSRGLINSSIATTAGLDAAYTAATPIATADAATNAKAAGYNADEANQFAVQNATFANNKDLAQLQANTSLTTAQLNADTSKQIAKLNNDAQVQATQLQTQNSTLLNTNSQAASAFNQAMTNIANINTNPNTDGTQKTFQVAQQYQTLQQQLQVLSATSGVALKLNLAGFAGYDFYGNWVGFNPDGTTALPADQVAASKAAPAPAPAAAAPMQGAAGDGG